MSQVDIDLDYDAILRLTTTVTQELAEKGATSTQARARRYAPKRTGALAASIQIHLVRHTTFECVYAIGSDLHYAPYQEWGTGPIFAKPGGVLVWQDGGVTVFAKHTSGVPATHFMAKAGATITLADFE